MSDGTKTASPNINPIHFLQELLTTGILTQLKTLPNNIFHSDIGNTRSMTTALDHFCSFMQQECITARPRLRDESDDIQELRKLFLDPFRNLDKASRAKSKHAKNRTDGEWPLNP